MDNLSQVFVVWLLLESEPTDVFHELAQEGWMFLATEANLEEFVDLFECEKFSRFSHVGAGELSVPGQRPAEPLYQVVEENLQVSPPAGAPDVGVPGGVLGGSLVSPPHVVLVLFVEISDPELGAQTVIHQVNQVLTIQAKSHQEVGPLDVLVNVALAVDVLQAVQHLQGHRAGGLGGEAVPLRVVQDPLKIRAKPLHHQKPICLSLLNVRTIGNQLGDTQVGETAGLLELFNLLSFSCPEIEMDLDKQGTIAVWLNLNIKNGVSI